MAKMKMDLRWGALLALCWTGAAQAASVSASSVLTTEDGTKHAPQRAFDGRLETGWAEDEMGVGEGSWLEVRFDRPTHIQSVSVWPGDLAKGERTLKENGRPHTLTIQFAGGGEPVEASMRLRDGAQQGIQRVDLETDVTAKTVRIRVDEAYAGWLRNDTYVAEVAFNLLGGDVPGLDRVEQWAASDSGQRAQTRHRDNVVSLFDTIHESQFGDRDSLHTLMTWASDGAPWMRDRVQRDVPPGFRLQAVPPDDLAIEALLKIKDANAIPALKRAALRMTGAKARRLHNAVSYFEAYTELSTGGRRSIPVWGSTGWEKGALQSLGEPMGVGLGEFGDLYIADVANHRISVFDLNGRTRDLWGRGQPGVTDAWFGGTRKHYVAGAEASTEPRGFSNPLDLLVIDVRDGEELLVVDAEARLQWLDVKGQVKKSWKATVEMGAAPGVGGAAHLVGLKKGFALIWGNEAILFDEDGVESNRWYIEDGAPITAVALRNGKLALGFARGAVMYGTDGYRHAQLFTGEELPIGYEAWAMQLDEKGKMWVVTDPRLCGEVQEAGQGGLQGALESTTASPRPDSWCETTFSTSSPATPSTGSTRWSSSRLIWKTRATTADVAFVERLAHRVRWWGDPGVRSATSWSAARTNPRWSCPCSSGPFARSRARGQARRTRKLSGSWRSWMAWFGPTAWMRSSRGP